MTRGFAVKIRAIASAFMALVIAVGVLSGCGSKGAPEEVMLSVWCAGEDIPMISRMVDEFKEMHKDEAVFSITISAEGEDTCKDTILANPEAAADVFSFAADQFNSLYDAGVLLQITEDADRIVEENGSSSSGAVMSASRDGKLYAYPATASNGYFLYYNTEYLTEDDVKSFDRILEVAAENGKKVTMDYSSGWYIYSFFKGAGLEVTLSDDGKTNICNWNATSGNYTGVDVAQAMLDIANNDGFLAGGDDILKEGAKNGSVIAGISGTWLSTDIMEAFGEGYAAAKLPEYTIKGDSVQMHSFAGYKFIGVSANTKNPKWSQLLAQWLTNEENQLTRFRERGEGPSNVNAASTDEVKASIAISALSEQSVYGHLQNVADTYWNPTYVFGTTIAAKNMDNVDLQVLLDTMVTGIMSEPEG
ncbi:MAG: extracellular solute-binding protein [Oscillospiraceae bacterium]|nr:extracellular solute-binding protein [Oscillospiraceae bacterium]